MIFDVSHKDYKRIDIFVHVKCVIINIDGFNNLYHYGVKEEIDHLLKYLKEVMTIEQFNHAIEFINVNTTQLQLSLLPTKKKEPETQYKLF